MPFDVDLPPPTRCPSWCSGCCCYWQPAPGGGYIANHESDDLAPPGLGVEVILFQVDEWTDGILNRLEPQLVVDQQAVPIELLRTVLAMVDEDQRLDRSA